MCIICSVVRIMVVAMVNFIPMMSFGFGWIVMVFGLCFCVVFIVIFFVNAFFKPVGHGLSPFFVVCVG